MIKLLVLKSRAGEVYGFNKVDISRFLTGFTVNEERYQKDLESVLVRYGRKVRTTQVALGDLVTIGCTSDLPRFNKGTIPVIVGKGLLDPRLESALLDMGVGESKTVTIDVFDTTMTVKKIMHTELPELTDKNVAAFGMEGVSTVADLRKYCIARQVDTFVLEDENADMAAAYVWQEVAKHAEVDYDPDELAFIHTKAEKKMAELNAQGTEMPEGEPPIDIDMLERMYETELNLAAVGQKMMLDDTHVCLTEDDYVAYIDKLTSAYPQKTRDEIEDEVGYTEFMIDQYSEYLANQIDAYIASVFKAHFTKE